MGKSHVKKQLRRLEREINHFQEQQLGYDRKIGELERRRQQLLARLNPERGEEIVTQSGTKEVNSKTAAPVGAESDVYGNVARVRESCLRVKAALEKVSFAGENLIARAGFSMADLKEVEIKDGLSNKEIQENQGSRESQESQEGQAADILEVLNSPKFRQVANELLGELLKDD
ncbi:MAG: hypothetical protein M0021_07730 [Clostridia bacterium]|nr:hypothetical protein [Clostridia bacterium]